MAMNEPSQSLQPDAPVLYPDNTYYRGLIDWNDANDPLRKLVEPAERTAPSCSIWSLSDEENDYLAQGYRHTYRTTAFLMVPETEAKEGIQPALDYVGQHPEIRQVVLAGGDSLNLPTERLRVVIERLREIPLVGIIRLSSKLPVVNPMRIYEDEGLIALLRTHSTPAKRIYVMAHVHHPRELTPESARAFQALQEAGAIVVNRTPILGGVNDDPEVLAMLLDRLTEAGVTPYYFFLNRPAAGRETFAVPLERAYGLVESAKARTAGLGRRVRLSMNHRSGLIDVLAVDSGKAYLKYHPSLEDETGKFLTVDCPPHATWFEELPDEAAAAREQAERKAAERKRMPTYLRTPYHIGD
ncbi:KamA family radical SAM protein [Cohnella sp. REN36]|uniref:KamA family radical SAM protein n=1 Tax=Cohnella sp. REN36 TaxID=2887347 RepID=UPI001D15C974|nr:KamA family radical SAM protein [Cohnella sp. REN36]MCC3377190.1 KamA family radical SAM protein [Cohnella sp. REN36]